MSKSILFILLFSSFILTNSNATDLVSCKLIRTIPLEELQKMWKENKVPQFIAPVRYGIDVYDVVYYTKWYDGTAIKASGLYFVPKSTQPNQKFTQLIYHHGTSVNKTRHYDLGYNGEGSICMGFATDGYAVLAPDYIGLGHGEKFHLYQHADSEGQAAIDMLIAVQKFNKENNIQMDDKLFLTGYSQGGHATLATHRKIQKEYADRFKITASSPMSGAYDMSGAQSVVMFKEYTQPHYLPYLLHGYNEIYKVVQGDFYTIFKPPYNTLIPTLFDDKHTIDEINKALPKIPKDMVTDSLINEFVNNPNFPFLKALDENNVFDWKPNAPVQMCYCNADEEVTYKNALVAHKVMRQKHKAKNITLRNAGRKFGHAKCALFATIYTKMYFDSFRKGSKKGRKGNAFKRFLISLSKLSVKP